MKSEKQNINLTAAYRRRIGANMAMESLKKNTTEMGEIKIIRPSKLAESGTTGVVAEGVFEGAKPNKYNNDKNDYFIRGADNTLYIINETKSLKDQLGQPGLEGLKVRVEYSGKVATKNRKTYHTFEVFADRSSSSSK